MLSESEMDIRKILCTARQTEYRILKFTRGSSPVIIQVSVRACCIRRVTQFEQTPHGAYAIIIAGCIKPSAAQTVTSGLGELSGNPQHKSMQELHHN